MSARSWALGCVAAIGLVVGALGISFAGPVGGPPAVDAAVSSDLTSVPTNVIPSADNTYDIGSSSLQWADGYFQGEILAGDGSATAPSLGWLSDADGTGTGAYLVATGVFGITSNGVQVLKLSNSSNNAIINKDSGSYYRWQFGGGEKFAVVNDNAKQIQLNAQTVCGTNNVNGELRCKNSGETALAQLLIGWKQVTIAADDTTPDVSGGIQFTTSANSGATAITDLDSPSPGQVVTICGGSDTNSSTIADSGNFALSAAMTLSLDDCITLLVQADNDYVELSRVNN